MKSKLQFIISVLIVLNFSLCSAELVASWDFEEGLGQKIANNEMNFRDLTLTRGPSLSNASIPEWANDGISGKALRFVNGKTGLEGDRDFLIATSDIDLSPLQLQTFTIEMWIKLTSIPPVGFSEECPYYLINMGDNNSNVMHNYWLRAQRHDDRYSRLIMGWNYNNNSGSVTFTHPANIEAGKWYRIIASHDPNSATDNTRMWVNGEKYVANTLNAPEVNQISPAFVVGAQKVTNRRNRSFDGYMDSLRIYNHAIEDISELPLENCNYPGTERLFADFDGDCKVDLTDFTTLAANWLQCSDPEDIECEYNWLLEQSKSSWRDSWRKFNSFPIAAWAYWHRYEATQEQLQTYANANLTMAIVPLTAYEGAVSSQLRVIFSGWEDMYNNIPRLDYYLTYPSNTDKSVAGYILYDEPNLGLFSTLAVSSEYVQQRDYRGAIPIVNLLPIYSNSFSSLSQYENYVDAYISQAKPLILSYDNYPLLADGTDRVDFYQNMEIIRERALTNNMDFMGFALVAPHETLSGWEYRRASESDLRWQVYSLIAYGAQGIFYYNYHKFDQASTTFGDGFVDADNNPTTSYYMAKAVNSELINLGNVLLSLKSETVRHTSDNVPLGTTAYSDGSISGFTLISGTNFVISEFKNIDGALDNDVYIMLVNKRHNASADSVSLKASISFTASGSYPYIYKYNSADGNLQQLSGSNPYTIEVNGGQGVLLRLSSDNEI